MKKLPVCLAALFVLAGPARAERFETVARKAHELSGPKSLGSLFWSLTQTCKGEKNDFRQRQCEGVLRDRAARVTDRTYLVRSAGAVRAGEFDKKKKSVPLSIESCVSCEGGKDAEVWVVGKGRHRFRKGQLHASELHETSRTFSSAAQAKAWREHVLPRLRTEFLIRLPKRADRFKSRAGSGYKVEVIGFRVFDPCEGSVLAAKPKSGPVPADRSACGDEPDKVAEADQKKPEPKKDEPKKPALPAELSPSQIKKAMSSVQAGAQKCLETFGVPGTAKVRLSISGDGTISSLELKGDFADTPTGECVLELVRKVTFPKSQKKRTTINYPIMLR